MNTYTPTEGDVLELTQRLEHRYIIVDQVSETTCYFRRFNSEGELLFMVRMPIELFVQRVAIEGATRLSSWTFPATQSRESPISAGL